MCPEKILLSAYSDGEIEDPWKKTLSSHIQECDECRHFIDGLARQKESLKLDSELLPSIPPPESIALMIRNRELTKIVLRERRRKLIPSVSAAAAALFAFFISFFVLNQPADTTLPMVQRLEAAPLSIQVVDADVEDIGRLLELLDSSSDIHVELPVEVNLILLGDSQLVRAADYNGGSLY